MAGCSAIRAARWAASSSTPGTPSSAITGRRSVPAGARRGSRDRHDARALCLSSRAGLTQRTVCDAGARPRRAQALRCGPRVCTKVARDVASELSSRCCYPRGFRPPSEDRRCDPCPRARRRPGSPRRGPRRRGAASFPVRISSSPCTRTGVCPRLNTVTVSPRSRSCWASEVEIRPVPPMMRARIAREDRAVQRRCIALGSPVSRRSACL